MTRDRLELAAGAGAALAGAAILTLAAYGRRIERRAREWAERAERDVAAAAEQARRGT